MFILNILNKLSFLNRLDQSMLNINNINIINKLIKYKSKYDLCIRAKGNILIGKMYL